MLSFKMYYQGPKGNNEWMKQCAVSKQFSMYYLKFTIRPFKHNKAQSGLFSCIFIIMPVNVLLGCMEQHFAG